MIDEAEEATVLGVREAKVLNARQARAPGVRGTGLKEARKAGALPDRRTGAAPAGGTERTLTRTVQIENGREETESRTVPNPQPPGRA